MKQYYFYLIQSPITNMKYVGQTFHTVSHRISIHKTKLKNWRHENYLLQTHTIKYGQGFLDTLQVVEIGSKYCSHKEAMQIEKGFIKENRSHHTEGGYNNYPAPSMEIQIKEKREAIMQNQLEMKINDVEFRGSSEDIAQLYQMIFSTGKSKPKTVQTFNSKAPRQSRPKFTDEQLVEELRCRQEMTFMEAMKDTMGITYTPGPEYRERCKKLAASCAMIFKTSTGGRKPEIGTK